jgi:hypothetical protein
LNTKVKRINDDKTKTQQIMDVLFDGFAVFFLLG